MPLAADLVLIGRIGRPHGLRGHSRAWASGPTLTSLAPPIPITLAGPSGTRSARVIEVSGDGARVVVRIEGVSSREQAASLTGGDLLITRDQLPSLADEDEFYVADLIGADVVVDGASVGRLTDVLERPANDVLEVRSAEGRIVLVPFVTAAVRGLDRERGVIALEPWALEEPE